ncbi:MAG: thiamine phosphate synthase [Deltaproteobacteria bacterium]|jgi:thiamine-phosphate pyrophosphorylase|nr:thiamine phosphate synthase [Deltaproteobacteria bacterium]
MTVQDLLSGVYVIVDNSMAPQRSHEQLARAALDAGARVLQLRAKTLPRREVVEVGRRLRDMTRREGALFILNDLVDVALLLDADGVHLGQGDFPLSVARRIVGYRLMIGISTHDPEQAQAAARGGADYIGFGPVFATGSKQSDYEPTGLDALRAVAEGVRVPVVAIGGLTAARFGEVLEARATAGAFLSAVCAAPDVRQATADLVAIHRQRAARGPEA